MIKVEVFQDKSYYIMLSKYQEFLEDISYPRHVEIVDTNITSVDGEFCLMVTYSEEIIEIGGM